MTPTLLPHAFAALTGFVYARREKGHRSIARAIVALLSLRIIRDGSRLLRPDLDARLAAYIAGEALPPYEGVARLAWAVDQTVTVGWYVVLAWAVAEALRRKPAPPHLGRVPLHVWKMLGTGAALVALAVEFTASYPAIRGRAVEALHVLVFLAALTVQCAAATMYAMAWRRPTVAQFVALALVIGSVADLAGPMLLGQPVRDAAAAGPAGVLVWAAIGGAQAWAVVTRSER